jgi:hypothetical protein
MYIYICVCVCVERFFFGGGDLRHVDPRGRETRGGGEEEEEEETRERGLRLI